MRFDRSISIAISALRREPDAGAIAILMYHSISSRPESAGHPYFRTATSPARFSEQMEWLAEAGAEIVELEKWNSPAATGKSPRVIITFDDGFSDFLSDALPALNRHGYPSTVFLPTAFIGTGKELLPGTKHLAWGQIEKLSAAGVTFGSHTARHLPLATLSRREIYVEVETSAESIEKHLGKRVISFSCPYAYPQAHPETLSALRDGLRNQGYTVAVTTKIGTVSPEDDPLSLRRLPINSDDDKSLFLAKIRGGYDWLGRAQQFVRHAKKTLHL